MTSEAAMTITFILIAVLTCTTYSIPCGQTFCTHHNQGCYVEKEHYRCVNSHDCHHTCDAQTHTKCCCYDHTCLNNYMSHSHNPALHCGTYMCDRPDAPVCHIDEHGVFECVSREHCGHGMPFCTNGNGPHGCCCTNQQCIDFHNASTALAVSHQLHCGNLNCDPVHMTCQQDEHQQYHCLHDKQCGTHEIPVCNGHDSGHHGCCCRDQTCINTFMQSMPQQIQCSNFVTCHGEQDACHDTCFHNDMHGYHEHHCCCYDQNCVHTMTGTMFSQTHLSATSPPSTQASTTTVATTTPTSSMTTQMTTSQTSMFTTIGWPQIDCLTCNDYPNNCTSMSVTCNSGDVCSISITGNINVECISQSQCLSQVQNHTTCCLDSNCVNNTLHALASTTQTMPITTDSTTVTTISAALSTHNGTSVIISTTQSPYACSDVNDPNVNCTEYATKYNLCSSTDPLLVHIATTNCPMTCNRCPVCDDVNDPNIDCHQYATLYNLCTSTDPFHVELATKKCPKTCNLCPTNNHQTHHPATKRTFSNTVSPVTNTTMATTSPALMVATTQQATRQCIQCGDLQGQRPCSMYDTYTLPPTDCPAGLDFCMTDLWTGPSGGVYKRCVSEKECQSKWLHFTSDLTVCKHYSPSSTGTFECHFCCRGDGCNTKVKPESSSLYH